MTSRWITTTETQPWQEGSTAAGKEEANLVVTGERRQTWEGFGGCFNELGWIALQSLAEADRAAVLDALFDPEAGCRFNLCRLPIGASDYAAEWYSHDETDGDLAMEHFSIERDRGILLPYIREGLKRRNDMVLFASPWSPPTWMKFPKAYNYGTMIWKPEILDAYALYFVKFVQAYAEEGVTIHQIHMQNEPVADQKFPSCLWTGARMRDFIRDHLAPAFRKAGLETELWLGTLNTDDYNGFPNTVFTDPAAYEVVAGVGFQWTGKGMIQRVRASWPEKRLMQTENECGNGQNTWAYATYVHNLLQHYITNGVVSYVYWNMVLQPGGESTWGWHQNSMVTVDPDTRSVTYNPEFYVMKHLSAFVAPGARNAALAGPWAGNAVAFENPDGSRVVAVNNPFEEARPLRLDAGGETVQAELPPASFNTVVISS